MTPAESVRSTSPSTGANVQLVNFSTEEAAARRRSIGSGDITTAGRSWTLSACGRSR